MVSLRSRLTLSYILLALLSILLISVLANLFLERQFRQYIKRNIESQNRQVVALLSQQYARDGNWDYASLTGIGMSALEQGLIIKISDLSGRAVWDANKHNSGLCKQMIMHMAQNMLGRYPNWKGGYVRNKYPINNNFNRVGTVEIGYYGPVYFRDTDLAFINTLNRVLMGVTVLALFLALAIGNFMAKRLSTPIARVINTAQQIAAGNLGSRSREKTNVKEINQLTGAVNDLAETLQQQELLRKRLTADVAHELRTPLATVQSHLEAMIDGIWQLEVSRLKSCHEEITRISRMVKDLEKLAKYEGENLNLHKTRFDISELITRTVLNFEAEFHRKGVAINFLGAEKQYIEADHDKISQVLINLISNSLKYTPAGGVIEIKVYNQSDTTEISIKDTGAGISAEDLPQIFERFYRADKSRNRLTGGSGIGLTIVKAIVEAHKGSIKVQSQVGAGTEFVVSIPNAGTDKM